MKCGRTLPLEHRREHEDGGDLMEDNDGSESSASVDALIPGGTSPLYRYDKE